MSAPLLRLGPGLDLPLAATTQTFGIVGKRGVGKTSLGVVMAEELLEHGAPVAVLDPIGVWWGLRSRADGKGEGYPVLIIGGSHGDLPLEVAGGRLVADFVVSKRASVVIDMGELSKSDQCRFVTDFLERVYQKNRLPLHLVLDEADAFAPQRLHPGVQRCFGAVDQAVRRGRARGLGVTLVTQRSAAINKDVLTQIEVLVAFRTIAPQDRAAIEAWVEVHADRAEAAEVLRTLATLKVGEAWVWSPAWLSLLKRVQIRKRTTFDSSATPEMGQTVKTPKAIAAVDVAAFRTELAQLVEKAEAEDPSRLQAKVRQLERDLAAARRTPAPTSPAGPDPKMLREIDSIRKAVNAAGGQAEDLGTKLQAIADRVNALDPRFARPLGIGHVLSERRPEPPAKVTAARLWASLPPGPPSTNGHAGALAKAERAILTTLIQAGPATITRLALIAGYTATGGGFQNALGKLRSLGLIEGANTGVICVTANGSAAIGPVPSLPSGERLIDYWLNQRALGKAERTILEVLAANRDRGLAMDELAEQTGYTATGGGFQNALGRLRTIGLLEGRNTQTMRLSRHLAEIS